MRASWEALHAGLDRSVRTLQADQAFQQAKQLHPALAGFDEPKKLVAHLTSKGGDLDEKDRILSAPSSRWCSGEHHEVASAPLARALARGSTPVYRRRLRHFRDQPDELVAELAEAFTALVERLDLTAVHRVAATLVRSTERDVMDHRKRRWAEVNHGLEGEANEPLRDLEGGIFSASWFDKASLQRWAASDHDLPSLSFEEDVAVLRAWLEAIVGADAEVLLAVLVLDETQREAGERLGLTHDAARKRFQRALGRLREHLATSLSHSGRESRVCPPRNR
ncbi:MAG: sigma-70 family RNA polymerase sigma factor [Gemmatimonadetes bacterium]|nr:sigma-70 family RNA polymerase sigma factor [Gemmatimonadota bacterium]